MRAFPPILALRAFYLFAGIKAKQLDSYLFESINHKPRGDRNNRYDFYERVKLHLAFSYCATSAGSASAVSAALFFFFQSPMAARIASSASTEQ